MSVGPGAQHIDSDAAFLEFKRPTSCKCLDRRLAAGIDGMAVEDLVACDRASQDDRSAATEQRRDLLHTEEYATRVGRELGVEFLNADATRRFEDDHSRIGRTE